MRRPVFVPNGYSRRETAVLLVGTAEEFGLSQRGIAAVAGGFYITEELAGILVSEADSTAKPAKKNKKTSGDRAAKNNTTTKE